MANDSDLTNQLVNISVDKAEHVEFRETWVDVMASYTMQGYVGFKWTVFLYEILHDRLKVEWLLVTSFKSGYCEHWVWVVSEWITYK